MSSTGTALRAVWLLSFGAIALVAGIAVSIQLSEGCDDLRPAAQVPTSLACPSGTMEEAFFDFSEGLRQNEGPPKTELARVISNTKLAGSLDGALGAWAQRGLATLAVPDGRSAWDLTRSEALLALPARKAVSDVRLDVSLVDPDSSDAEPMGLLTYELADSGWQLTSYSLCSSLLSDDDFTQPTREVFSERELAEHREADRLDGLNAGNLDDDG